MALDDFTIGERIINYIRWALISVLLLFNNIGLAEDPALIWPVNVALLLALGLSAYVQVRLHRGRSFGPGVTLAVAAVQDLVITGGVYLTGLYESHVFIFYYASLLGLSLVFPLRTILIYTTAVGGVYTAMILLVPPGIGGDPLAVKVLIERWLVLYIVVLVGWFLVREERSQRVKAVAAERRAGEENERLYLALNTQLEQWKRASQEMERNARESTERALELGRLAGELGGGRAEIDAAVRELVGRAASYITQVDAIAQMTDRAVAAASELASSAGPTGKATERSQAAIVQTRKTVQALNERSQAIAELAAAVRQVADQTNLLAFNANIEAIQAGHRGQRFAVVANEVRLVAERAIHLAREIDGLSYEIGEGTRRVLGTLGEVAEMMAQTVALVQATSRAGQGQQDNAQVVAGSLGALQGLAQQNAADVHSIAAAVQRQGDALQRIAGLGRELAASAAQMQFGTVVGGEEMARPRDGALSQVGGEEVAA